MRAMPGWRWLRRIVRTDPEAEIDRELEFHFEQKVSDLIAEGLTREAAHARAVEEFGDVGEVRAQLGEIAVRRAWRSRRAEWWEAIALDLRYLFRTLRRSPGFTAMVVVTLALGLGANAAIFSLLDRLYLRAPSGISDASTVRRLYQRGRQGPEVMNRPVFGFTELRDLQAVAPAGVILAGFTTERVSLGQDVDAPKFGGVFVQGDYFALLGVRPALGRFFSADEQRIEGLTPVAVIGHELWQRRFNADSQVIGKALDIGSHHYTIIGVSPAAFRGTELDVADLWLPLNTSGTWKGRDPAWFEKANSGFTLRVIARVPNEAAVAVFDARATASLLQSHLAFEDSLATASLGAIVEADRDLWHEKEIRISTRLAGVSAIILLIACANVVNLLLARAMQRRREIALRLALGVSRRRLIGQLVAESAVLGLLSSVAALAVATVGAQALRSLLLPNVVWADAALNERVAIFTVVVALITGSAMGLVPALQASRPDLSLALKSGARDGTYRTSRLRSTLLMAQAALSIVLLAGAGVFVRSMWSVEARDLGYDTDRVLFATVGYDPESGNRRDEISRRLPEAMERIRRIPGVENAALSANAPLYGFSFTGLYLPDRDSLPASGGLERVVSFVSPEFFSTVGIHVLRGRGFSADDRDGNEAVVAMNQEMAANLWPGQEPLGKCLIVRRRDDVCRRVVGIVSHAHFTENVSEGRSMQFYLPLAQASNQWMAAGAVTVRTSPGRLATVAADVRRELGREFGSWSRPRSKTLEEVVARALRPFRIGAALFCAAGLLALLVAAVGVYSSIAYTVSQRAHEMGVRVALGARGADIMRLVVGEGVRVVVVGVVIGLAGALALGSVVASMLYQTSPRDPIVLGTVAATLLIVAVAACAVPAWRASHADPIDALRSE